MGPPSPEQDEPDSAMMIPGPPGVSGSPGVIGPASGAVTIGTAMLPLSATYRRSGVTYLEPTGGFTAAQVGKPVVVVPAPRLQGRKFDEAEMESVPDFAAEILDRRRMRLFWASPAGWFRGGLQINYLIGA
jgi:hypothetical protein